MNIFQSKKTGDATDYLYVCLVVFTFHFFPLCCLFEQTKTREQKTEIFKPRESESQIEREGEREREKVKR